ncbi:ABC transporter permease [Jiangella mangrovi]|uniref:ABC-2 type transport system permease protein n=1 Tax=Jiangella mangrovi TaxID=1524084 RepID=A0A7W9GUK3_9ACTN|nr:ABC transporter permease [Jiangella mangrovi]MBB5790368.1 ABC-2 type transport system permease protein [Jiangella mangrovi]
MTGAKAALAVELVKASSSRVIGSATILLVAGIGVLAGSLTAAAQSGNEQVLAQLGTLAGTSGWDRYLGVAAQVTAAGATLGFGVTLSWMIGREFADGTVAGLFALPVSRAAIAVAKLAIHLLWAAAVATVLVALLATVGALLRLGPVDSATVAALGRQLTLTILSAGLAMPAAWAATLGRGLLPGVATTIGIIVVAQVTVVAGTGAWLPLAAPALWALEPESVSLAQLALALVIPLAFALATLDAWRRLQLT